MLNQFKLMDVGRSLGKYLLENENIKDFCETQFGKPLTVYVGEILRKTIPTKKETPYVVIQELAKKEGTRELVNGKCEYTCTFFVGVEGEKDKLVYDDGLYFYDGCDVLDEFIELIQSELNKRKDGDRLPEQVSVTILGALEPDGTHWGATMEYRWKIHQTLNYNVQDEF